MRAQARLISLLVLSLPLIGAAGPSDYLQDAGEGTKLSQDRIPQMEGALLSNLNDGHTRARLLGFYSLRKAQEPQRRLLHVLWFVQNLPADPFTGNAYCAIDADIDPAGYEKVKALWKRQQSKDPNNPAILSNAANFLLASDDATAEDLLKHGADLEPQNPHWPEALARLYELRAARSADVRVKSAAQALAERDKAFVITPDARRRFVSYIEMPRDAYVSGDTVRAKELAAQLLAMADNFRDDPNFGTAIHFANIFLGRVALSLGDVEAADGYLMAAAKAPASAQLAHAGPDMSLAKELLQRGERKTVHDYLGLCGRLWTTGSSRLKSWQSTVDDGGSPDFGNLAAE